jgi:hypothetical protein
MMRHEPVLPTSKLFQRAPEFLQYLGDSRSTSSPEPRLARPRLWRQLAIGLSDLGLVVLATVLGLLPLA